MAAGPWSKRSGTDSCKDRGAAKVSWAASNARLQPRRLSAFIGRHRLQAVLDRDVRVSLPDDVRQPTKRQN